MVKLKLVPDRLKLAGRSFKDLNASQYGTVYTKDSCMP